MYTIDEIRQSVLKAVDAYNEIAREGRQIIRVELFGSYANGSQSSHSDVDFLVEFASPVVGLFALAQALELLEQQFDCAVDMVPLPLPEDSFLEIGRTVPLYAAA